MADLVVDKNKLYDSFIIGIGPAGLNAALYLRRKGYEVAMIGRQRGGQVADTSSVENYLGFKNIGGFELVSQYYDHVMELDVPVIEYYGVTKIEKEDGIFKISCEDENVYTAKTVVFATGSSPRKLGIPGEDKLYGRGVTYCATCDGPLYRNKKVVVAGGGNSAVEAAIDLSKITNDVTLIHRSEFRADKILIDQMNKIDTIKVKLGTIIKEVNGDMGVESILLENKETKETENFIVDGVFVEIGHNPNTELVANLVNLNQAKEIITDENGATSLEGFYAAGDVTQEKHKQIIVAAASGAKVALEINEYLMKNAK